MDVVHERCAGLDVHKKSVTACVITPEGKEIRTFSTMTRDLLEMGDWLLEKGCTHVAMESTGVYWKPVVNLLEGMELEVLVVNAQHIKAVPGRKTDVKDAEWIAELLRHGLLRGSFIPDREHRELRELVAYRRRKTQMLASEKNRVQKTLEGANIKLGDVATDVFGKSGRAMLNAIVAGNEDPEALAGLAKGKLRSKSEELKTALQGVISPHQRMMLATQLELVDFLQEQIDALSEEIHERIRPFEPAIELLDAVPGLGRRVLEDVLSYTGTDMSHWPTHKHFASWAKLCPGSNESAGKRKSGRTGRGHWVVRSALVEAAHAAGRTRGTYLSAQYRRIASKRGRKRAAVAVAHTLLVIIYHMLKDGTVYEELGGDFFDKRNEEVTIRRAVGRLEALGYSVSITKNAA